MIIEAVGKRNIFELKSGKNQVRKRLFKKEFCNCIGCVISTVDYSNKGCRIWMKPKNMKIVSIKVKRDVLEKTYLIEVSFDLYNFYRFNFVNEICYLTILFTIYCIIIWSILYLYIVYWRVLNKNQNVHDIMVTFFLPMSWQSNCDLL